MSSLVECWNPIQAELKQIIYKKDSFERALQLSLELNAMAHASEVSGINDETLEDSVWQGLTDYAFRTMPTSKDVTIAWDFWHITRIEDLVSNILIADEEQVFTSDNWKTRLGVAFTDTGNAMSDEEILKLSCSISPEVLREYRNEVGRKAREVLTALQPGDFKLKPSKARLQRILDEGGVLPCEDSKWLLDFWGRKDIGGLVMMPLTRHHIVHLNDAVKLKKRLSKGTGNIENGRD